MYHFVFFFKQKTAYEMRISDWSFRRVLFRSALLEVVKPAYERVFAFAESELPKAAVNPTGVGQTHPDGAAYYAYQLKRNTSTDMTAEQIHELGLSEVKRLRGELEKVQAQIGFEGDLQAFFKHMQDDPARLFPTTSAGRQAYKIEKASRGERECQSV